jgi:hypothetical protein
VQILLLPSSCPRRLAAISHQPPTLLTAISRLSRNEEVEVKLQPTVSRPMTRFVFSLCQLQDSCCGAPSLTRGWVCNFLASGPCQSNHSGVQVPQNSDHSLPSHLRLPQPGGQVLVFISPRNRVAQLYPRALGSIFVTSDDS